MVRWPERALYSAADMTSLISLMPVRTALNGTKSTREPRDEARKRGFSATGRAPEKHGAEVVAFDLNAQRLAGPEKFFLADEFIKRARPHALGERLVGGRHAGFRRRCRQF